MVQTRKRPLRHRYINIPIGVSDPKGDESTLANAVARLAPHAGEWIREDGGPPQQLSEGLARQLLDSIARRYNANAYVAGRADRYSDIDRKLRAIERRADSLARELANLTDFTATVFINHAVEESKKKNRRRIVEQADLAAVVRSGRRINAWARRTRGLSRTAAFVRARLAKKREFWGRSEKDNGGNVNQFTDDQGTPKWRLMTDALYIYEIFKPGKATGYEGGDLHQFVSEILQYASGQTTELTIRPLRDLVVATREENKIKANSAAMLREMEELPKPIEFCSETQLARLVELCEELRKNDAALAALSRKTWPHKPMILPV